MIVHVAPRAQHMAGMLRERKECQILTFRQVGGAAERQARCESECSRRRGHWNLAAYVPCARTRPGAGVPARDRIRDEVVRPEKYLPGHL